MIAARISPLRRRPPTSQSRLQRGHLCIPATRRSPASKASPQSHLDGNSLMHRSSTRPNKSATRALYTVFIQYVNSQSQTRSKGLAFAFDYFGDAPRDVDVFSERKSV
jgi:hypothetical protein